jgi:hypothetical protein
MGGACWFFSNVARGAGALVWHPARRERHKVANGFILLETAPTLYYFIRRTDMSPILSPTPKAIAALLGSTVEML